MKNRMICLLCCIALAICSLSVPAKASGQKIDLRQGDPFVEQARIRCTCYTDTGITSTGHKTRHGIVAGSPEWYGCVVLIWSIDEETGMYKDFLGYYEVLDTGAGFDLDGDGIGDSIKNGQSIDVWCESDEEVRAWQKNNGDYVLIQLVRGVG